jgi:hypothetical protein
MDDSVPDSFAQLLSSAKRNGGTIRTRLHESLFEEFGPDRIDDTKTNNAYIRLFGRLMGTARTGEPLPFPLIWATTNYDRSPEVALATLGSVRTGFVAHGFRTPVLQPRDLGVFDRARPAVLYLHGAVGWHRRAAGDIIAMPADQGYNRTLGSPAVLYPGPDKEIARAETVELWEEFDRALGEASHVFVLGHGLNDAHLVAAINRSAARVAVTYHPGDDIAAKARRITDILPGALPVACDFSEKPEIEQPVVDEWIG